MDHLPADIGRMKKLEYLALTNNKLQVNAIPYTLTFCTKLKTILLDNNLLDALPGFLLSMPSIETVYRHGNHNYFKATFMWYHTDVNYRIIPVGGFGVATSKVPASLQFWAAKSVIGLKIDFYNNSSIADILKNYLSDLYSKFYLCHHCDQAILRHLPGKLSAYFAFLGRYERKFVLSVHFLKVHKNWLIIVFFLLKFSIINVYTCV